MLNLGLQNFEESNPVIKSISQDVRFLYEDGVEEGVLKILKDKNEEAANVNISEALNAVPK